MNRPDDLKGYHDLLTRLPESLQKRIEEAMCESQRFYHERHHLGRMWRLHQQFRNTENEFMAYIIGFHDIVYDTYAISGDNEKNSAAVFMECQKAKQTGLSDHDAAKVYRAIIASSDHLNLREGLDTSSLWFLDLDFEPMASEHFKENGENIRREYGHISDGIYEARRRKFLTGISEYEKNIFSSMAPPEWEENLRHNIAISLGVLPSRHKRT